MSRSIPKLTVSEKINKAHAFYTGRGPLVGSRKQKQDLTEEHMGMRWNTIQKYLKIKEGLHEDLLPYLDKKGKEKLSLGLALKLIELVWNPEYQLEIFPVINGMKNKVAIESVKDNTECLICCVPTCMMEKTPCCGTFYCFDCQKKTMETSINDVAFLGIKCPFCKTYFSETYIQDFLYQRSEKDPGIYRYKCRQRGAFVGREYTYMENLFRKFGAMMSCIEIANRDVAKGDYKSLFEGDLYYGPCSRCTPGVREMAPQLAEFGHIQMCHVEKQCANGEGDVVVLNDDMFVCVVCKSYEENYEDGTFKKCPHCGIKTLKPSGCNYVKCGDHRWCFICNERLEVSHDGHNTHYYTGPGSSAYSSVCRQSINSDKPKFILKTCECSSCAPFGGMPLCRELECMERTHDPTSPYCAKCANPFTLMVKYYRRFHREPQLHEMYQK